ncbi:MAG: hypothetical protein M3O84_04905 [Actinomycetota bacterium]|nr:hypothetical protein [Actinomycetota bacterium]
MRPRGLGDILSAAFEIYKNNAGQLLMIVAIVVIPLSLIGAVIGHLLAGSTTTETLVTGQTITVSSRSLGLVILGAIVAAVIAVIISAVLQAAIIRGAAEATIGDPVDIQESYRWGFRRIGSVILVGLLVGLAVAVGFILLVIPGIIFLVFFSVSIPALVIENRRGTEAMKRSWFLVGGSFWHAFGVIIVAALITGVVSSLLGAIGGSNWFTSWIFSAIAQIITVPFSALVSVLLYLDLRSRKEALTATTLRAELASNA